MRVVSLRFPAMPGTLGFAFALVLSLLPLAAVAQTSAFDVADGAVVSIEAKQADVLIKTWDRPTVQVETDEDFAAIKGPIGRFLDIPVFPARLQFGETRINLPPEDFPVTTVSRDVQDGVKIGSPLASGMLTVTVPTSTAFVVVRVIGGRIRLNDYRGGTFFVQLRNGVVALTGDGGEGFVQLLRGHLSVTDSNFSRLRARTAAANMLFENCRARQIEASSVAGSIVYDNGSFEPGLARFDSTEGNVAVGVSGNGQIGARTGDGHIYTSFDRRVPIDTRPNETNVSLGGAGSPAINAFSNRGNVFLYDGSLGSKGALADEWTPMRQLYVNRRRIAAGRNAPRQQPRPITQPHKHAARPPTSSNPRVRTFAVRPHRV